MGKKMKKPRRNHIYKIPNADIFNNNHCTNTDVKYTGKCVRNRIAYQIQLRPDVANSFPMFISIIHYLRAYVIFFLFYPYSIFHIFNIFHL